MRDGLLWYDDSGLDLAAKVTAAARRHKRKYGTDPDTCYVHPSALTDGKLVEVGGVRVEPSRSALRHHYWIGVETMENKPTPPQAAEDLGREMCEECDIADYCDQAECLLDLAEKEQDYHDEQRQAWRPL